MESKKMLITDQSILIIRELVNLAIELFGLLRIIRPPDGSGVSLRASQHFNIRLNQILNLFPGHFHQLRVAYRYFSQPETCDSNNTCEFVQEKELLEEKLRIINQQFCDSIQILRKTICELNVLLHTAVDKP